MNRKHLLWHVFQYMESQKFDLQDMIEMIEQKRTMFSDNPGPAEWSVGRALSHAAYEYENSKVR